ncbi:MAG: MGDG synthase family glycosyltransferase [Verrucomicrobiota bacterium]
MKRTNKVLIFTSSFGEGHKAAARNLQAGMQHATQGQGEVVIADPLHELSERLNIRARDAYLFMINKIPLLYGLLFDDSQKPRVIKDHLRALRFVTHLFPVFEKLIEQHKPDVVCSVYPFYSTLLKSLTDEGKLPPLQKITLITDSITIHPAWLRDLQDTFFVPDQLSKNLLEERAVPAEQIKVFGFPVSLDFALPEKRKSPPSLEDGNSPSILYIGNSNKKDVPTLLKGMLEADSSWRITVTGLGREQKDLELTEKLQAFVCKTGQEHRVKISNWATNMPELLMTHHVVIGKAGGATVNEAISALCPMIINKVVPGQEEGNLQLLRGKEALIAYAEEPHLIVHNLQRAFANNGMLWKQCRQNLQTLSHPDAALKIAKHCLALEPYAKGQDGQDKPQQTQGQRLSERIRVLQEIGLRAIKKGRDIINT